MESSKVGLILELIAAVKNEMYWRVRDVLSGRNLSRTFAAR
jgi:hypothetical protein